MRDEGTYADKETNLVYNVNRYRDLDSGRFTQADLLGLYGGDLSLYVLRKNNPLRYVDRFGLDAFGGSGRPSSPSVPGPFDILFPGTPANNDFVRSINNLVQKVKDFCTAKEEDACFDRWDKESKDCQKWSGFGDRWVRACQDRANHRLRLCYRNGGKPDSDEPPVWRPD